MLCIGSTCEGSMAHNGTKVSQLMHFHIFFFLLRSPKEGSSPPVRLKTRTKMRLMTTLPNGRVRVKQHRFVRFELRVAALGCIASHAAHRLSSSKMELRSYQWKNPQTQLLVEAPPFLCTGRFCGERVAKKRKGIERRHAIADIKANEGTNGSIESSWCEVPPGTPERLQFFTGAPQFFRMKRLSARLVYSVTNS